jgi:CubicO group peptidase (beta-lactamase class C family)
LRTTGMVVLIAVCGCATAAPPTTPTPASARGAAGAYAAVAASIRDEIGAGRLTGVSVALVQHGEILWEAGFGWADHVAGREATSRTPFSIASITKSFTTTAIMTLVAAGRLSLDRPANDYLGSQKIVDGQGPAQDVTVRRLTNHSSGLPVLFEMYRHGIGQVTVNELLRDYGRVVAPVGERYEYSNIAMAALGEIVARQSGQELGAYLQAHVLTPLGLADSFFDTDVPRRAAMAKRYNNDGLEVPFYLTATPGSGEMFASAHDLARWAMFHLGDAVFQQARLLTAAQLDELHRPATPIRPPAYMYAMGWRSLRVPGELDVLYHGGGQLGVAAQIVLLPSRDAGCVVLSNRSNDRPFIDSVCRRMLQTIVPAWRGIQEPPDPGVQPLVPLVDYTGHWHGQMIAQRRPVAIRLTITGDRRGTLAIGDGPATPITDLGLSDGVLVGDARGDLGSPDSRRNHVEALALKLTLRGTVLDGEIIGAEAHATLPNWVELRR